MNKQNQKSKSSYWPHGIILFFLVVFGFNFWFAYQASISHKGAVEEDVYEKSRNYQQVINLKKESAKLGWKAKYNYTGGVLYLNITDSNKKVVENLNVEADLIILSDKGDGQKTKLEAGSKPGTYQADVELRKGLYQLKILASSSDKNFYDEYQLLVS